MGMIWVFGWAAVILVAWHLRNVRREVRLRMIHEERMKAMEKGIPLPEFPELDPPRNPSRWLDRPLNPRWPLGVGAFVSVMGLGVALALFLSGDSYHQKVWPFGLLGPFAGVGLFLQYRLMHPGRPSPRADER